MMTAEPPGGRAFRTDDEGGLVRGLTPAHAFAIVMGTMIGTGIFIKPASMASLTGGAPALLGAWIAAGLLSLAGALTYAELASLLPRSGGEYPYLRAAYGRGTAFLFGWTRYVVGGASVAAVGAAFAAFASALLPVGAAWHSTTLELVGVRYAWEFGPRQVIAVGIILAITAVNCARVAFGGRFQTAATAAKLVGVCGVAVGGFFLSGGDPHRLVVGAPTGTSGGITGFGAAVFAALWAYSGWNNLPMVAGEVRDPTRNVPRAIVWGVLGVMAVYLFVNAAYLVALPFERIASAHSTAHPDAVPVGALTAETFLGATAGTAVTIAFLVSSLGTLNGSMLTVPRIPFAMTHDGVFPRLFGRLSPRTHVPVAGIAILGAWSAALALSGTFDQLTTAAIFADNIFYALAGAAVFVLRRTMPDAPRRYRAFGYPVVSAAFVAVTVWLLVNTAVTNPVESAGAAGLAALGIPVFFAVRRASRRRGSGAVS